MQVLQRRPVLRQRSLLPYVLLPGVGSANVPAWNDLFRNFDRLGFAPDYLMFFVERRAF